jgi:cytochrome o ubiquinol oxidase subunit 3
MTHYPDAHHDLYSKTIFGFWVYLLTDFMLFAVLFATYAVLHNSTYGGPSARELFNLPFALVQTLLLLISSFICGLGGAAAHKKQKGWTIALFSIAFLFGLAFIGMEFADCSRLVSEGASWKRSAFLSAFFTLVGTHGLHILFGLLWMVLLIVPVCLEGVTPTSLRRLSCLRMFWQFLNVIWVFIFSFVYLMG